MQAPIFNIFIYPVPGHPTITCTSLPAFVGDMNVKIECFVGGHKDLACDQFKWVSKTDDSDYSTKGNYTVQCAVSTQVSNQLGVMYAHCVTELYLILEFSNSEVSKYDAGLRRKVTPVESKK